MRRGAVDRLDDDVTARRDLGLPEREVDHVHSVADGRFDPGGDLGRVAIEPELAGGNREDAVVPEVRARRDPRDLHRAARRARSAGVVVARGDPGDVRPVHGLEREQSRQQIERARQADGGFTTESSLPAKLHDIRLQLRGAVRLEGGRVHAGQW